MSFDEIKKNISYFVGDDLEFIIAAGVAFILLIALLIYRALKDRKSKKAARLAPPAILDSDEVVEKKPPSGLAAVMTSLHAQEKGEADDGIALSLDDEGDMPLTGADAEPALDENIDLDIPRVGETESMQTPAGDGETDAPPPKKKHGLFSFGSKDKDMPAEPEHQEQPVENIMDEIAAGMSAALSNGDMSQPAPASNTVEELQDLERQMKALRELHDAGLIATEIYLHKSRELAAKSDA